MSKSKDHPSKHWIMPFLYCQSVGELNSPGKWVVEIATYDLVPKELFWVKGHPLERAPCLVPDMDVCLEKKPHVFKTQAGAMRFIKRWWKAATMDMYKDTLDMYEKATK